MGAGRVTAPSDRRGSSTAVSSEVKVRARRARRVHTNTDTRARRPFITLFPRPGEARSHATSRFGPCPEPTQAGPPPTTRPHGSLTHERPQRARTGLLLRVAGFLSATPRHAARFQQPARTRHPESARAERLGCCVPSKSHLKARSQLASLSPPTRSHDSCCRPKTGRYNKKQSFPLSPPTSRPPPTSPSLPVLCKTSRQRRSDSRYQTSPSEPRPGAPSSPSRSSGMRPHPGSHSRLRRIPSRPATRSGAAVEKALTMGPNFMLATGMRWGKLGKGLGARTPCVAIFGAAYPSSNPPPPLSPSHQLPCRPPPHSRHTRAPSPVTRVSPVGLPGAARARDAASPSLPPASPSAHRGRAPQGDPGIPRQSSAPILPCFSPRGLCRVAKPGRFYPRPHVHVPRRPLCLQRATGRKLRAAGALGEPCGWGAAAERGVSETGGSGDSGDRDKRLCPGHKST